MTNFVPQREPPYTERYVRWCERTGVSRPLLLDFGKCSNDGVNSETVMDRWRILSRGFDRCILLRRMMSQR
jgi:hypothetical protein